MDSKPPSSQVSAVTKSTGFAEGLYDSAELDSGNFKDKDAKLDYLKKIVDCVGVCLGEKLDVRGAKVKVQIQFHIRPVRR